MKKIDFIYNTFPKNDIYLEECTQKKESPSAKKKVKKQFRACGAIPLPPPGAIEFLAF